MLAEARGIKVEENAADQPIPRCSRETSAASLFFGREKFDEGEEERREGMAGERKWTGVYRTIAGGGYFGGALSSRAAPRCTEPRRK